MTSPDKEDIIRLEQENEQLKSDCASHLSSMEALEIMFAEASKKQLHAEISSMELEHIFAAVTDAIWVIRDDGIIIRANDAMLAMLDLSPEQVIGQNCCDLLDYNLCHTESCPLLIAKNPQKKEFDIYMSAPNGEKRHYILNAAPMTTIIGTTAIICQFKDITLRKEAEQKLEEANRTLSMMARLDGLTQIANRRCFDETMDQEWKRLLRTQKPLALVLIDIDYFKKYNDSYGHQAGDDCLIKVAKALESSALRPSDMVARYGGEEFVLLLPETDINGAQHVGERAAKKIAELKIPHKKSDVADFVSLSMGAAVMIPTADSGPEKLIAEADLALYQAKEAGRNRLTIQH